jgi:hypothetical protein
VNSEELELSLRTEFESYLKGVLAGMQQDVADFQKNFEAEFEKHRSQMDDAFRGLSERFSSDVKFDKAFTESVVEHLRLARDDGAQLSAEAFAEAQKLDQAPTMSAARYDQLRDAINDISSQMTQAAILNSLVDHVSNLTPRGAFFIAKNETFVCWRRFDRGQNAADDSVRDIQFPVTEDTLLADAVRSLATKEGSSHANDSVYLDALGFAQPQRMVAVPLTARGRGVAVLYVDSGYDNSDISVEAVESLVRVAGLTVELRAASTSAQTASVETQSYAPVSTEQASPATEETHNSPATTGIESAPEYQPEVSSPVASESSYDEPSYQAYEQSSQPAPQEISYAPEVTEYMGAVAVEEVEAEVSEPSPVDDSAYFEPVAVSEVEPEVESSYGEVEMPAPAPEEKISDFAFSTSNSFDVPAEAEVEPEVEPVEEYAYAGETKNGSNGHSYEPSPEPVVEVATAQPVKSRLSERHVDLPIEVSEDERRFHNEARRFARLLVSEIKLYNEQKVNEGRDSSDLYDRLREAIDRSREMYEKRVQPQVAAKFDYFHYELVSNLAEGSDTKLGTNYPGASV